MSNSQLPCAALQERMATAALQSYAVTPTVVLAAQPQPADWRLLADAGIHTVLNIRSDPARAAIQGANAEAAGLRYIHAPWPAYELSPQHLAEFAALVEAPATGAVCIHCRSATRVGLFWLLYRMEHCGWSRADAEAELRAAGYDDDALETFTFCADDYFDRVHA